MSDGHNRAIPSVQARETKGGTRGGPFEDLPKSIFLDTNVVNCLVKWGEEIFDFVPLPGDLPPALTSDIEAFRGIFSVCQRAKFTLLVSHKTMDELHNTPDKKLRKNLVAFGSEFLQRLSLASLGAGDIRHARDLARRLEGSGYLAPLRDAGDRELVAHAVAFGCDTFCTQDIRTIHRKQHRLTAVPLRFMTPTEWWDALRPWAALWV